MTPAQADLIVNAIAELIEAQIRHEAATDFGHRVELADEVTQARLALALALQAATS